MTVHIPVTVDVDFRVPVLSRPGSTVVTVHVLFNDGSDENLFDFDPFEVELTESDFLGLTRQECEENFSRAVVHSSAEREAALLPVAS